MKFVHGISLFSAVAALAVHSSADAAQTPAAYAQRPAFEVAQGAPVRVAGELDWYVVPAQHRKSWSRLVKAMGTRTNAVWDHDTGVVRRIWGAGVEAPGTLGSPELAERTAREFLDAHLALLAPGAVASDFVLVSNHLRGGMRTLGFVQHRGGLPVDGGQVSFRFKNDRLFMIGSEALPHVPAPTKVAVSDADAAAAALAWVHRDTSKSAVVTAIEAPRVLPLIRAGRVDYATVIPVVVRSTAPHGRWNVYVDVATGAPVARVQTLKFGTGTVYYNAPVRGPSGMRMDYPAYEANLTVNGQPVTSTPDGVVNWGGNNAAPVTARAVGNQWAVNNEAGPDATQMLNLNNNGVVVWNAAANVPVDAQVTIFAHANVAMNYMRNIDAQNPFHSDQFDANANINDSCNAYYDGQSINFFSESQDCNNTGRVADIVYHEYGHGVHEHAIIDGVGQFEGALSEGVSDYLCCTITGDPAMALEFFKGDNQPLRHIDPPGDEAFWPDDIAGDTHTTGLIIGGALWDLRKALVAQDGPAGIATADRLFYEAVGRAIDIPTMYFEAVAADDDDGNLDNGTPNLCLINAAFAAHGLYKLDVDVTGPGVAVPQLDGYDVSAKFAAGGDQCGSDDIQSADVIWRLREDPNTGGQIAMDINGDSLTATIPKQPPNTVVQYQIKIDFQQSNDLQYPDNRADPFYEFFVGAVEDIYCTDFESDPAGDGWTHGLSEGEQMEGADDWMWGVPMSPGASGDPDAAFDGTHVYGNDLGGGQYNGTYQPEKTNFARSQAIDTTGYGQVRLQYRRWLNVEDGFFDQATLYANDQVAWSNLKTPDEQSASVHHTDREWRFHDVDLTSFIQNDAVTLKWEINSDGGLEMGGWTLDALCVVGVVDVPGQICGDGIVTAPEDCDDGPNNSDSVPDACRTDCTSATCGDGVVDSAEDCDDGNQNGGDDCPADCGNPASSETGETGADSESNGGSGEGDSDDPTDGQNPTNPSNPSNPTEGNNDGGDATAGDESGSGSDTAAGDDGEGCGCRQDGPGTGSVALLGLALLGLRRRRR